MLMITCPVFERMLSEESNALFKPDMVEYDGKMVRKIRDPEVHPDVMHAFLCYLYSEGKIERLEGAFDKEKLFFAFSLQYVGKLVVLKAYWSENKLFSRARAVERFVFTI